jgi:maltoporin
MRFLLAFFILAVGPGAAAAELDFHTYMRAPMGTNSQGGKQILLNNPGSRGNEFRLGNESAYAEAYLTAHLLKGATPRDPYFLSNLTLAYSPPMNSQYSDTTATGDYAHVIQAFAKGGNLDGVPAAFWAGKRHYRDVDVHMNDFYYFANMGGVGGGVEDIYISNGTLNFAYLQYADRGFKNATNGLPAKQALDFRWRDFRVGEKDWLHLWGVLAYSAPGNGERDDDGDGTYTPVEFEAGRGYAAGVRWYHQFAKSGNNFAVMYGHGIMEDMGLNSAAYVVTGSGANDKKRWRVVNVTDTELSPKWQMQAALIYDGSDNAAATDSRSDWYSIGARPIYFFTDHYHLAFEAGMSVVKTQGEVGSDGTAAGERILNRVTISPEVALGRHFYSRPVVRAFLTHTWWNSANGDLGNNSSLLGSLDANGTPGLNGQSSATAFGLSCEVWF